MSDDTAKSIRDMIMETLNLLLVSLGLYFMWDSVITYLFEIRELKYWQCILFLIGMQGTLAYIRRMGKTIETR